MFIHMYNILNIFTYFCLKQPLLLITPVLVARVRYKIKRLITPSRHNQQTNPRHHCVVDRDGPTKVENS